MSGSGDLRGRLRDLPKAELHLHALGAMRPETILDLAQCAGGALGDAAERGVAEGFRFEGLPEFVQFFMGLFGLVTTADVFERVAFEVLEDAALQGVAYAELRWTPTSHLSRGADEESMFAGIDAGRRAAERMHGIVSRAIVDFPRSLPLSVAEEAARIAVRQRARGVVGFDVAGDERAVAADPRFAPVFALARAGGLHACAHAGEGAGPESVAGALDLFGARRIGHGTRGAEDPALVTRLARDRVVLEVCPSSNEALRVVDSVARHPVRRFVEADVPCVVSSDDPTLFGTDLLREYERLHREAGLSLETLRRMAVLSLESTFLEAGPTGEVARDALRGAAEAARRWEASVSA